MLQSSKTKLLLALLFASAIASAGYMLYEKKEGKDTYENPVPAKTAEADFSARYIHENPFFSFAHTDTMRVQEFDEEGGEVILLQETQKEDVKKAPFAFQIFVMPFSTDEPLTKELITRELPELDMRNIAHVLIDSTDGLVFISGSKETGDTREVWFAHEGFLYQASALLAHDELFSRIMATWKFE